MRVQGGQLSATLRNAQANVDLQLELKGYSDGFVRLTIDETPEVGRCACAAAWHQAWGTQGQR